MSAGSDEDEYHSAHGEAGSSSSPDSPTSPLARVITSFFSARSFFGSSSEGAGDPHDPHDPHATPVPDELIDQFLSELNIRFPDALDTLKRTGEIKRTEPVGSYLFALRILRAQKLNIKSAIDRTDEHARWRQTTLPGGIMEFNVSEDNNPHVNENKVFLVLKTKAARPCLIVRVVRHTAGLTRPEILKQYIVYCMELAVYLCDSEENPDQKIDVLFDARGMKWANYDVSGLRSVFEILEKRFFERIHVIYMYDGPRLLDMLWKVVSPFVDEKTRGKIQFLTKQQLSQMLDVLGADEMPEDLLGVPIHRLVKNVENEAARVFASDQLT